MNRDQAINETWSVLVHRIPLAERTNADFQRTLDEAVRLVDQSEETRR